MSVISEVILLRIMILTKSQGKGGVLAMPKASWKLAGGRASLRANTPGFLRETIRALTGRWNPGTSLT